jgi:hypothetical protein
MLDTTAYDPFAIFDDDSPINPCFMQEAVRMMMRALPLDTQEPKAWVNRRMHAALIGLAAMNPRDEIEVMYGVQAMCAYHAACANWHLGMNFAKPSGNSPRHFAAAPPRAPGPTRAARRWSLGWRTASGWSPPRCPTSIPTTRTFSGRRSWWRKRSG